MSLCLKKLINFFHFFFKAISLHQCSKTRQPSNPCQPSNRGNRTVGTLYRYEDLVAPLIAVLINHQKRHGWWLEHESKSTCPCSSVYFCICCLGSIYQVLQVNHLPCVVVSIKQAVVDQLQNLSRQIHRGLYLHCKRPVLAQE